MATLKPWSRAFWRGLGSWLGRASPWAGRLVGLFLGLAASWYGLAAGLLLGYMVDRLRSEARLRAWLAKPERGLSGESPRGIGAATALALLSDWPKPGELSQRRRLLEKSLDRQSPRPRLPPGLLRLLSGLESLEGPRLAALARDLALKGSPQSRLLLADFAYALAAETSPCPPVLDHGTELELRLRLLDSGLSTPELKIARAASFPEYRDPWEILGVEPGTGKPELKKAWRRLSKSLHPDHGQGRPEGEVAASFLEAKGAYEFLLPRL